MQTVARGWEQSTCGLGAWRLGPGPGLLPPGLLRSCLLGYLVEAAGEEAERRKERSGERGREQSTCGLAPWSWSSALASWAPWWKLLVRKRRRGRKGPAEDPPESEKKGRERLDGGCPPPPTFRCAAALSPFSLLSLSESQLSPFPRAGHPSARAPPRAGRAFPRAPPALRYGVVFYP